MNNYTLLKDDNADGGMVIDTQNAAFQPLQIKLHKQPKNNILSESKIELQRSGGIEPEDDRNQPNPAKETAFI